MENEKKELFLKNLEQTYCRLKPSGIEGVGVFAVRDIPKNINPFFGAQEQTWLEFTAVELEHLDKNVLEMVNDFFVIEKNGAVYIPEHGLNGIDISFFVNNSETPNLKIANHKDEPTQFVTARSIKKGEELTVLYATYDDKYK